MMTMLEVRNRQGLLGWLPANPITGFVRFAKVEKPTYGPGYRTTEIYEMPIQYVPTNGGRSLVVNAEGIELETLRMIPSFKEATE